MGLPRRAITLSFQYDAIRDRTADMSLARAAKGGIHCAAIKTGKAHKSSRGEIHTTENDNK